MSGERTMPAPPSGTCAAEKADWLAGLALLALEPPDVQTHKQRSRQRNKPAVELAFRTMLQSELNWFGDSYMDRAPQVQMRPPTLVR
jgi:hypothetical protein